MSTLTACAITGLLIWWGFLSQKHEPISSAPQLREMPSCIPGMRQESIWNTYNDVRYHFRMEYPLDLAIRHLMQGTVYMIDFGGSYYAAPDGPLTIIVESTQFSKPEEWIDAENKRLQENPLSRQYPAEYPVNQLVPDRRMLISGHPAIIAHFASFGDHDKIAAFIKDGNLFQIRGNGSYSIPCDDDNDNEYERIWNSFRFEEQ